MLSVSSKAYITSTLICLADEIECGYEMTGLFLDTSDCTTVEAGIAREIAATLAEQPAGNDYATFGDYTTFAQSADFFATVSRHYSNANGGGNRTLAAVFNQIQAACLRRVEDVQRNASWSGGKSAAAVISNLWMPKTEQPPFLKAPADYMQVPPAPGAKPLAARPYDDVADFRDDLKGSRLSTNSHFLLPF